MSFTANNFERPLAFGGESRLGSSSFFGKGGARRGEEPENAARECGDDSVRLSRRAMDMTARNRSRQELEMLE